MSAELKKRVRVSFGNEEEIDCVRKDARHKLNMRNALGLKSPDDWIFNLNIGNVMHLSPLGINDLRPNGSERRVRDLLLEQIVNLAVAYFCVGTELRFLHAKVDRQRFPRKDAEMWHAKALHTSSYFLPSECPLVSHIINSYSKHHLRVKVQVRRVENEREEARQRLKRAEEARGEKSNIESIAAGS